MMPITKIISGGQTGADQGGLWAAKKLGIPTGGFAPMDFMTENGPAPWLGTLFGLEALNTPGYLIRTRMNVQTSDATVLFGDIREGGTFKTLALCEHFHKEYFHVFCNPTLNIQQIPKFRQWLLAHNVHVLNVAGNRESKFPGIEKFTEEFLVLACV